MPKPCTFCGCPVENVVDGLVLTPYGLVPSFVDNRIPVGWGLVHPTMCWECRGAVILRGPL